MEIIVNGVYIIISPTTILAAVGLIRCIILKNK